MVVRGKNGHRTLFHFFFRDLFLFLFNPEYSEETVVSSGITKHWSVSSFSRRKGSWPWQFRGWIEGVCVVGCRIIATG